MARRTSMTKRGFASKIEPHRDFIVKMRERGATYAEITAEVMARYQVKVSIPWVCQFTRRKAMSPSSAEAIRAAVVHLRDSGRNCTEIVTALESEHRVTAPREAVLTMMRGNPFQSKLEPHRDLVFRRWRRRHTYAEIAAELATRHDLRVSLGTIYNFIKVRLPRAYPLSPAVRARQTGVFARTDPQHPRDVSPKRRLGQAAASTRDLQTRLCAQESVWHALPPLPRDHP